VQVARVVTGHADVRWGQRCAHLQDAPSGRHAPSAPSFAARSGRSFMMKAGAAFCVTGIRFRAQQIAVGHILRRNCRLATSPPERAFQNVRERFGLKLRRQSDKGGNAYHAAFSDLASCPARPARSCE
jgi:hypothetical protein